MVMMEHGPGKLLALKWGIQCENQVVYHGDTWLDSQKDLLVVQFSENLYSLFLNAF